MMWLSCMACRRYGGETREKRREPKREKNVIELAHHCDLCYGIFGHIVVYLEGIHMPYIVRAKGAW